MGVNLTASLGDLIGSTSAGGSVNSAQNFNISSSNNSAAGFSRTFGSEATAKSYAEAIRATERQRELMHETMKYNTSEAEAQRNWQEAMANTVYTRSVKNMIEAGINPVLAASAGLSAANVGSGASASIGVPSAFMGQTFADQISGYTAGGGSYSYGQGESSGSSWQNSMSGLAVGLEMLGKSLDDIVNAYNSSETASTIIEGVKTLPEDMAHTLTQLKDGLFDGVMANLPITGDFSRRNKNNTGGGHSF